MSVVRQLDTAGAAMLVGLVETFEELQVVLRGCERLVTELDAEDGQVDGVVVEAIWTTALLSYARCFASGEGGVALTERDLTEAQPEGDVLGWHSVLLRLRDHYAHPETNPREHFCVGVAQGDEGAPAGVAVTSTQQPLVDDVTVRQLGAIAFALGGLVNQRIEAQQERLMDELKDASPAELASLPRIEVAEPAAQS
jgi:hypothetical protein